MSKAIFRNSLFAKLSILLLIGSIVSCKSPDQRQLEEPGAVLLIIGSEPPGVDIYYFAEDGQIGEKLGRTPYAVKAPGYDFINNEYQVTNLLFVKTGYQNQRFTIRIDEEDTRRGEKQVYIFLQPAGTPLDLQNPPTIRIPLSEQ